MSNKNIWCAHLRFKKIIITELNESDKNSLSKISTMGSLVLHVAKKKTEDFAQ